MRQSFCVLNVRGDVLDGGELYFVEAAQSLDAAKARVQSLAESWPGGVGEFAAFNRLLAASIATELKPTNWPYPTGTYDVRIFVSYLCQPRTGCSIARILLGALAAST